MTGVDDARARRQRPAAPPPKDPGRALPEPDGCLTCSDEAVAARVVSVDGAEALVETVVGLTRVALDLVDGARPGDVLLCHAGIALARLSTGAGANPSPPPRATARQPEVQRRPERPSNRLLLAPVDAADRTTAAAATRPGSTEAEHLGNRLLLASSGESGGVPDAGGSPGASA